MIIIDIFTDRAGFITGYQAAGHAEDAPQGSSIVCAWVSAVTQMALIGLEQQLKHPLAYTTDETKGLLRVQLKAAPTARTQDLLYSMELTLAQLAQDQPGEITLNKHRG
ncbi:MAG: ribosomal-processing cysteine protease Prp [Acidaminococcaceae bacterium]|jgi:uncharacterized protein YsxB (DUF464 family)|nr:ribosomal-processing cysteine protease Prp [Acidaminococcaceae bacterium]